MELQHEPTMRTAYKHMKQKDYRSALDIYNAVVKKAPTNAEAHYHRGDALIGTGQNRSAEAIAAYDTAIKIRPNYGMAHFKRGLVLFFNLGRDVEAFEEAAHAAKLMSDEPSGLPTFLLMGFILSRQETENGTGMVLDFIRTYSWKNQSTLFQKLRNEFVLTEDPHVNDIQMENLAELLRTVDYLD